MKYLALPTSYLQVPLLASTAAGVLCYLASRGSKAAVLASSFLALPATLSFHAYT